MRLRATVVQVADSKIKTRLVNSKGLLDAQVWIDRELKAGNLVMAEEKWTENEIHLLAGPDEESILDKYADWVETSKHLPLCQIKKLTAEDPCKAKTAKTAKTAGLTENCEALLKFLGSNQPDSVKLEAIKTFYSNHNGNAFKVVEPPYEMVLDQFGSELAVEVIQRYPISKPDEFITNVANMLTGVVKRGAELR
jgi:hypothetical protein